MDKEQIKKDIEKFYTYGGRVVNPNIWASHINTLLARVEELEFAIVRWKKFEDESDKDQATLTRYRRALEEVVKEDNYESRWRTGDGTEMTSLSIKSKVFEIAAKALEGGE